MPAMRRLRRRLFTFYSAASLLVCLLVGVLWVRSYAVHDTLAAGWVRDPPTSDVHVRAYLNRGVVTVWRLDAAAVGPTPPGFDVEGNMQLVPPRTWSTEKPSRWTRGSFRQLPGFQWRDWVQVSLTLPTPVRERFRQVRFPHWLPMLLAAVAPALWLRRARRQRARARNRLCLACGYDLRASPGHCPECGTTVAGGT